MSEPVPLLPPPANVSEVATYVAQPRAKRSFNTVLDASRIFAADGRSTVATTVAGEGPERRVFLRTEHPLKGGLIAETFELTATKHLVPLRLERRFLDDRGVASREERIEFRRGPLRFEGPYGPPGAPEIVLELV